MCATSLRLISEHGRKIKRIVSRFYHKMTNQSCGTLGLPRDIINSMLLGWASVHVLAFLCCEAPCHPRWDAPKMWLTKFGQNSKSAGWKKNQSVWILPKCQSYLSCRKRA